MLMSQITLKGLQIIDISNPALPTLIGSYDTAGSAYSVSIAGSYAYVADSGGGLVIIKVKMTDTDNDGIPDVDDSDDDNDGISDTDEATLGFNPINATDVWLTMMVTASVMHRSLT